ncbi:MAG: acetylornithine transaminase [Alphaproteobacteria bacterium]|nr:acetylornithine transaminase [Alphaproteobacteria bacterium]
MNIATDATHALMDITSRPPAVFVKGEGSWLWDRDGKRYLDFVQGWAVNCLGHAPAAVADAISRQARQLITPSPAYYNDISIELAVTLTALSGLNRVFFTNSGAEANEGAIKLARKYGALYRNGASEIITFDNSFHGRTLATMSASGKKAFESLFEPKVPGFPKAQLNDMDSVRRHVGPHTVAVMLEPIQGEAGVVPATDQFLRELRSFTREHGLLLVLDEIQTGIGRTGKMFHYQHVGIEPDILTLGKGLGGGVPLAALLATEAVSCFAHGDQGGTFNGSPLMCAAGLAVVREVSSQSFLDGVTATAELLAAALGKLSRQHRLGEVRGRGLLQALALGKPVAPDIAARAFAAGLLVNAPRPDLLRFMPSLTVTEGEIETMIAILRDVLDDVNAGAGSHPRSHERAAAIAATPASG